MTLMARLKAETRPAHDRIERDFGLAERIAGRPAYRASIERFYGFHAAWERQAAPLIGDPAFFEARRKAALLVADLQALGAKSDDIAALPLCPSWPWMDSRAAAFGAMYVVEGSTLGGALIADAAERALGVSRGAGCAYFRAYGREVGRMWRAFGERLTALSSPDTDDAIVAAASRTFAGLHAWLCDWDGTERAVA